MLEHATFTEIWRAYPHEKIVGMCQFMDVVIVATDLRVLEMKTYPMEPGGLVMREIRGDVEG